MTKFPEGVLIDAQLFGNIHHGVLRAATDTLTGLPAKSVTVEVFVLGEPVPSFITIDGSGYMTIRKGIRARSGKVDDFFEVAGDV